MAGSTSEGQDQSAFLDQVASFYREHGGQLQPIASADLGRRAEHFASCVHFGLDHPQAMRQLSRLQEQLYQIGSLGSLVQKVLEGALSIAGGDFGNVQVIDPLSGSLRTSARPVSVATFSSTLPWSTTAILRAGGRPTKVRRL